MSTDPASVGLAIDITGLALGEAQVAFANVPPGATLSADVTQHAIGPKRYTIRVTDLSLSGAKNLATALHLHFERLTPDGGVASTEQ